MPRTTVVVIHARSDNFSDLRLIFERHLVLIYWNIWDSLCGQVTGEKKEAPG